MGWAFAIAPNNRFILSTDGLEYGHVRVRDFTTMALVRTIRLGGSHRPTHIVSAPDSQHVMLCDHDGYHLVEDTLCVFNLLSGSLVSRCALGGAKHPVITSDGRQVVFTSAFSTRLAVWDWQADTKAHILFDGPKDEMCFTRTAIPGGNKAVVSHYPIRVWPSKIEYGRPAQLRVWDLQTQQVVRTFAGYQRAATLPGGQRLVAIAEDSGALTILNIQSGQVESIVDDKASVPRFPWSGELIATPDGRYAIASLPGAKAGEPELVGIWDLQKGKLDHSLPWKSYETVAVSGDGCYLLKDPGNERWHLGERRCATIS